MERLTILYDNRAVEGFKADWGFSALVELEEENILFDTGAKPEILKENMARAGVDPEDADKLFISHNHWDHVGGLELIVKERPDVEIFVPEPDCIEVEEKLPETAVCVPVTGPTYISSRAISTGIMETGLEAPAYEQALIVTTQLGPVLITGCSHPSIVEIAKKAVSITGETLFLTVGGFHLFRATDAEVEETAKELQRFTQFVAPCHCTGEKAIEVFRKLWGDRFVEAMAGVEIPLEEE
ncbi:MBL fold metallo-hydrolase [Thermovibrio ammonificans]|uniref:Metal-dependent hydrolase n=1 Tax=Thermovibrio ammonificans (strain DSM 15698 / JCM 12110 / HB-1) TaxID=648996 RepID=E8T3C7_THEA1|nr:MBL fold metallo-hydrolase [Thermovibrio ammonificans]ADU97259.1 putative metal-dependent hydrolase [Thermovibrio ammonificans HB-1]